jgi:beta-lactamase class A
VKQTIIIITTLIIGIIVGISINKILPKSFSGYTILRSQDKNLTNPLIDCEQYESNAIIPVNTLKKKVESLISDYADIHNIAVYYRDLNNGPWFGINETSQFSPHSLLKVPILIAYLKKAETDPTLLIQKIKFTGIQSISNNLLQKDQLIPNTEYTVEELISRMIAYSDNSSLELLYKNIDQKYIIAIHKELDIPYPDNSTPADYLTVRMYAGLFRILYNSTYLSRNMSEKALKYLLTSDLTHGMRSGLPKTVKAALKYGIMPKGESNYTQFHECGIIYAEKHPYILCVMTKSTNLEKAVNFMRDLSKLVYEEVTNVK